MDLPLFLREVFRFLLAYKKRKLPYSRTFSYNILNFSICYFNLGDNKLFDLEIYIVKLKYTDTTTPFKMEIRLVYTEGNVCKDTKNHELQS